MRSTILPGSTIGVLGSGQLGRMFTIAAKKMGYRVHVFSPGKDTPTGQIADLEITAAYEDLEAVREFARTVDVVTFEFENVHSPTAEAAAELVPVRPSGQILHTTQNRLREKSALDAKGFPVTPFAAVHSVDELRDAIAKIGIPTVLKSASWGYDGKGQAIIRAIDDCESAWLAVASDVAILEAFVDYEMEVSVVVARGLDGNIRTWGVTENRHVDGILDLSRCPVDLEPEVRSDAQSIANALAEELDLVGVLCVEMFLAKSRRLLINEIAPRPHNSGHWTFDAAVTSQFEQQVRAICGLPLGSTELLRPVAMANLLGDLWANGEPDWNGALSIPTVKLHLYGKAEARPGRKMGHLAAMADRADIAVERAIEARRRLSRS